MGNISENIANNLMLYDCLENSAMQYPGKTAIISDGQSYTYEALFNASLKLASALKSKGIEDGDRVVVFMENSWPCCVAIYGIQLAGGTFVIINPQTKSEKLTYVLSNCEAKCLITDNDLRMNFIPAIEESEFLRCIISVGGVNLSSDTVMTLSFEEVLKNMTPLKKTDSSDSGRLASLIYTSGSTGLPKGVMQTHKAMVFTTWSLIEYLKISEKDRIILVLPMAFDYGLYQLLMTVKVGATLIVERSFAYPADIYSAIDEYTVTVFPAVPTIFATMINSHKRNKLSFPAIERVTSTAANLPVEFIPYLREMFPNALIYSMYGLTECKRVSYLEPELLEKKRGSVGKAIPGTEVYLLSNDGSSVEAGNEGILHVKGPHVMEGYWKNPELTQHMLKEDEIAGEKILCTHDRFKMDKDGFLYFVSRTDEIIKTRGEKVSPLEVEQVLRSIKGVVEAAVIGVDDPIQGAAIRAFIVTEPEAELDERKIKTLCLGKLENYIVPRDVIILDELPKSQNQKIDKETLKNLVVN